MGKPETPSLKAQLEAIWRDGRLRSPFGPVWWHDNLERFGGHDESKPLPLFYKAGKWTPNKCKRYRRRST